MLKQMMSGGQPDYTQAIVTKFSSVAHRHAKADYVADDVGWANTTEFDPL
jgi:hypothetical protein